MLECDREGVFRGQITSYGLNQMESGAIGVSLKVSLNEIWSDGAWHSWAEYSMEAEGTQWIVKKDGSLNQRTCESLMRHAGWDGNMESIVNETWAPMPVQVVIGRDDYEGKTRFRISFVNDYERTPGALSNVDANKAKELQARYGGQLRALGSNAKRNGTPATSPGSRPAAPPPSKPPAPPSTGLPQVESEQIPF